MAQFRKKPIIVEAEQYSRLRHIQEGYLPQGVDRAYFTDEDGVRREKTPICSTLEGPLNVSDGDWIIKGVAGEFYPCKPDIFYATYELVEVR